jgi:hypothetical protein
MFMSAPEGSRRAQSRRRVTAIVAAAVLAVSMFGGIVQAADSRDYSVTVSTPTPVSEGGATKFDIIVDSDDNQTIANVHLSVPAIGQTWPAGVTITDVFGLNAPMCAPTDGTSLSCDFGNIVSQGTRTISIVATVAVTLPPITSVAFSASAETNNETGPNQQIQTGISAPRQVTAFSANGLLTFNRGGTASTSVLGSGGAGNLQTTLNLIQDNGGSGNAIVIAESLSTTQPAICVAQKLTCQPDAVDVFVNSGSPVLPYLETTLIANVPKTYNIKKAFVIHLRTDGSLDTNFPVYNVPASSCLAHPTLIPCADFSLTKSGVLTVVVHTNGNGKFQY